MCARIGNYDISTETGELKIHWAEVHLLVHAGGEPQKERPPPFDQIRFSTWGANTRREIYMTGNLNKSAEARIQKTNNTWGQVIREVFRNKAFGRKIEILIWNSLIRSAMIYGLHTKGMPRHKVGKNRNIYVQTHKNNENPNWKIEAWYPEKPTLHETAAIDDGVMAQKNANRDNDGTDARQSNDTPERLQGNSEADGEIAETMETTPPLNPRTRNREARKDKGPTKRNVWGKSEKQNSCNS